MKKLLLAPALLLAAYSANAQLALENFNAAGIPAGWTMFSDGSTVSSTISPAYIVPLLNANAWAKFQKTSGDSAMISTSFYSTTGTTADRWLVTPSFLVPSASTGITFDLSEMSSGGTSPVEVLISTTGGATKAAFTTTLATVTCMSGFPTYTISLGAYNGQNVKVAFRNVGKAQGFPGVDNVQAGTITPKVDLALLSITPRLGSAESYAAIGSPITVSGVVENKGTSPVSSYKVSYQVGTSPVVTETKTLTTPFIGRQSFTFTSKITATAANNPVKVWVELTGDAVATNDTLNTRAAGYTTKPTKKMFAEEATGTWCQWCPRGLIYMDSIYHKYPNNVSVVAVHNADPMAITAYDSYITSLTGGGWPNMVVDRAYANDPSTVFQYYTLLSGNYPLASMSVTPTIAGTSLTVKATVTPTATTTGTDYKLGLILTEDRVTGTSSAWDQKNAYSGGASGAMKNAEYDFVALPFTVPASKMKYDFVAREASKAQGVTSSLPTPMTAGTPYTYTFSGITLDPSWKTANMKAIVLLINSADGSVLNTESVKISNASVADIASGINSLEVYPNPASQTATTSFSIDEQSKVKIEVVDMMGKVVKTIAEKTLNAGSYEVPTSVADIASGLYMIKVSTDKGTISERLSVVK